MRQSDQIFKASDLMEGRFPVACPSCGKHLRVELWRLGKWGQCSRCGEGFRARVSEAFADFLSESIRRVIVPCGSCGAEYATTIPHLGDRSVCKKCGERFRARVPRQHADALPGQVSYTNTSCPHCGIAYTIKRSKLGKTSRCTSCGEPFQLRETAGDNEATPLLKRSADPPRREAPADSSGTSAGSLEAASDPASSEPSPAKRNGSTPTPRGNGVAAGSAEPADATDAAPSVDHDASEIEPAGPEQSHAEPPAASEKEPPIADLPASSSPDSSSEESGSKESSAAEGVENVLSPEEKGEEAESPAAEPSPPSSSIATEDPPPPEESEADPVDALAEWTRSLDEATEEIDDAETQSAPSAEPPEREQDGAADASPDPSMTSDAPQADEASQEPTSEGRHAPDLADPAAPTGHAVADESPRSPEADETPPTPSTPQPASEHSETAGWHGAGESQPEPLMETDETDPIEETARVPSPDGSYDDESASSANSAPIKVEPQSADDEVMSTVPPDEPEDAAHEPDKVEPSGDALRSEPQAPSFSIPDDAPPEGDPLPASLEELSVHPDHAWEGHTGAVFAVAVNRHATHALSGGMDNVLRLWDLTRGQPVQTFEIEPTAEPTIIWSIALRGDGLRAISAHEDGKVRLWDMRQTRCIRPLEGHTEGVSCVYFDHTGRRALSGGDDRTLRLWDLETAQCIRVFEGHQKRINTVRLSGDGRLAVSGSDDKTVRIWDAATGHCLHTLADHAGWVSAVALSADARRLLSASWDKTLRTYTLK